MASGWRKQPAKEQTPPENILGEALQALRMARGWSRQELARRAGVTGAMLYSVERPVRYFVPTPEFLKKVIKALAEDVAEQRRLEWDLLLKRELMLCPPEIRDGLMAGVAAGPGNVFSLGRMPEPFLTELAKDLEGVSIKQRKVLAERIGILGTPQGQDPFALVLEGKCLLGHDQVRKLAKLLGRDPDAYQLLAQQIPESWQKFFQVGLGLEGENVFDLVIRRLPEADRRVIVEVMETYCREKLRSTEEKNPPPARRRSRRTHLAESGSES